MKPPTRHEDPTAYTPDEHFRAIQAQTRGEDFAAETAEYRSYRSDALKAAGLDDEAAADDPDNEVSLENMSPADHLAEIRGRE